MSVNSKMTAIANATRALDGSTAKLTLDGIASKLGVEKTNIDAALAAIAEKGVTVPDGSTSDALVELIASIEAGGGGEITFINGSFTPSEDTVYVDVEHNLGVIPCFALWWATKANDGYRAMGVNAYGKNVVANKQSSNSNLYLSTADGDITLESPKSYASTCYFYAAHSANTTGITMGNKLQTDTTYGFKSGVKHNWIVGGVV